MTEFGYVVCAIVAGVVLWQVVDELRWQKKAKKDRVVDLDLIRRVAATIPRPRVEPVTFHTGLPRGLEDGWVVRGSCDEERAEVIALSDDFKPWRVA